MTRKQRTILIVAFIAIAIPTLFWLTRRSIDQRFVGSWVQESNTILTFRDDGSGTIDFPINITQTRQQLLRWWGDGEYLFVEVWSGDAKLDVQHQILKLFGMSKPDRFRILEMKPESVRLEHDDGNIQTWRPNNIPPMK